MTHEEKVKMYKKLKKKEIIAMLIEANKQLDNRQPTLEFQPYYSFKVPRPETSIFKDPDVLRVIEYRELKP